MTTSVPSILRIDLLLIAAILATAPAATGESGTGFAIAPAEAHLTESERGLLKELRDELAERETRIKVAKEKAALLQKKLKSQEDFINDLNSLVAAKQTELAKRNPGTEVPPATPAEKGDLPASFLDNVTSHIVVIEGNKGNGTGFLCTSGGHAWVYTAAHVLSGNRSISVRDSKGRIYKEFEFLESAEGVDLVRLKLIDTQLEGLELASKSDAPEIDDLIVAVGNSLGTGSLSGEPGRILNVSENMWEVDAEIIPGNSGGPVLSLETGKVVGIVTHLMISRYRGKDDPKTETKVKRFAARLDKEWEWRKLTVSRFVKEWELIEVMDRDSSIAWASNYLMQTGPEDLVKRDSRYTTTNRTNPNQVKLAESILARERENFQVQRVDGWLKRYRGASPLQRSELINEGNTIIKQNLEEIRLKKDAPQADQFSWYHRRKFEEEIEWRKKLIAEPD